MSLVAWPQAGNPKQFHNQAIVETTSRDGSVGEASAVSGRTLRDLFKLGRHLVGAQHYQDLKLSAFSEWSRVIA